MSLHKKTSRFYIAGLFCLLSCICLFSVPVKAQNETEKVYSDWEQRIARELITTGQVLEGDPEFDDVVTALSRRGQAMLPSSSSLTQGWIRDNLKEILPELENKMVFAAMDAATNEVAKGVGKAGDTLLNEAVHFSSDSASYDIAHYTKETLLRTGFESAKAAAAASSFHALRALELDYALSEGGLDEYSVLTVQPLWESEALRHSVFAQGSYANKDVEDSITDTSERRDTVNAGLSYRYITPDLQHMIGANLFYDHQWPYHHSRISVGLDYKTSLYGIALNRYFGISDWKNRHDGYEEKALGGEDIELSGRMPQWPALELFAKGYHWEQETTPVLNPSGDDIWGYQFAAEYTPVNALTVRAQAANDNEMDDLEGEIALRFNYKMGQDWAVLWDRPVYNLDNVLDRRFDKVRRNNEIRVQLRQDSLVTARVTFADGANVNVGALLSFGTVITTGGAVGNGATVIFGNGARLDLGQDTKVEIKQDRIVLKSGLMQFTSGAGGIRIIAVPGGTINLIGTDVDVRVSGGTTTLRVRDGAANFTDDTGTTRVDAEELAEAQEADGLPPQIRATNSAIYETHTSETHEQLDLIGPAATTSKAAPYAQDDVNITGTLEVGQVITFTVPLNKAVRVTGTPQLAFTLGGADRLADYVSGSGSTSLVFTYTLQVADGTLSNIEARNIEKNGGTLTGLNGAPMLLTLSGTYSGGIPAPIIMGLTGCPYGELTPAANIACARLFGSDPTDMDDVMVYAGEVPGTTTDFFVRRCDIGMSWDGSACAGVRSSLQWKDSDTDSATVLVPSGTASDNVNATDGPGNTALLVADGTGVHEAAETCDLLPGGGWYLPAVSEVDEVYANLIATDDPEHPLPTVNDPTAVDNEGTIGPLRNSFKIATWAYYYTSTEFSVANSWATRFSDGDPSVPTKAQTKFVRCARRD